MNFRGPLSAALAAVLLGAAPRPAPLTVYSAPAAERPAGASRTSATDAVLPDGRISAPLGLALMVGTNPLGVALSPNGRFAVVSNGEQDTNVPAPPPEAAMLHAGYSLTVVDTQTMTIAANYQAPDAAFYSGVAAVADPSAPGATMVLACDGAHNLVRVFSLSDGGSLAPQETIGVPGFPTAIRVAKDGRVAYVTGGLGNTVSVIDLGAKRTLRTMNVGYAPNGLAIAGYALVVANGGLEHYEGISPARTPQFASVQGSLTASSSLTVLPLDASGYLGSGADPSYVRLDPIPDGTTNVGGALPSDVVAKADGSYAFVSLSNVDRVATVALSPQARVIGGGDLRFYLDSPYGMQPDALALSKDEKRLYVALRGFNAVAVIDAEDPSKLHRLGLIPTGDQPSALVLSPDGRYLYVASARGVDGWGLLQRVDLKKLPLQKSTLSALRYNRAVAGARINPVVPQHPARGPVTKSTAIDRVVYISVGTGTFDALFGDMSGANGDAALAQYGESKTPNFHALANAYGVADNFYVSDMNPDLNQLYALGGTATAYAQRTLPVNRGRAPLDAHGQDPEDYSRTGYVFNALQRAGISYRDYGALLNLSGYDVARRGRTSSGAYTMNVPALAALDGHVDLDYAGENPAISNVARAAEFVRDMGGLVQSDQQPLFTYVYLPSDGTSMTDSDRALGQIIAFLSRTPHWSSTAVFVVSNGIVGASDHVNRARTYALVISPLAKPGYVGHRHLSVASVLKTEEEVLGLDPLALPDLLSTDMADFFSDVPYPSAYDART